MKRTAKNDLDGYNFIRNKVAGEGVTPSLREIARAVGYASPRSVQQMLGRLQDKGLLSYQHGAIRLVQQTTPAVSEDTVSVPLVGSAACGLPAWAEEDVEAVVEVSTKLARPGHKYFLLRAKGESMNRSGINDGDLVLVRQQPVAQNGDKVVALIGNEATIKHFHRDRGFVILKPSSTDPRFQPIVLSEDFLIQGVVVNTIPDPFRIVE